MRLKLKNSHQFCTLRTTEATSWAVLCRRTGSPSIGSGDLQLQFCFLSGMQPLPQTNLMHCRPPFDACNPACKLAKKFLIVASETQSWGMLGTQPAALNRPRQSGAPQGLKELALSSLLCKLLAALTSQRNEPCSYANKLALTEGTLPGIWHIHTKP